MKTLLIIAGVLMFGGLVLSLFGGCRDQRLETANRTALVQQGKQNELIGAQSQNLAETTLKIATAAETVLAQESQVRTELLQQQARIDSWRTDLEQERQRIASQRQRDPIIAASLQALGLLFACLMPLAFGAYTLHVASRERPGDALAEVLVQELTSDQPRLLPAAAFGPPRLEHRRVNSPAGPDDRPPDDAPF